MISMNQNSPRFSTVQFKSSQSIVNLLTCKLRYILDLSSIILVYTNDQPLSDGLENHIDHSFKT